ncbi:hypothetical protein [Microbacterium sp. CR_7]|uniref:hypothetical protein n=1 Tax=Microbacterium sp. CR_7 TaxID=3055792 RepID=UPI0035BF30B8
MAFLGINGTTSGLWLAVLSDDGVVQDAPPNIALSGDTPLDTQIANAVDEATRLFERFSITNVVILDAETGGQNKPNFTTLVPRISLEAAVMYAAHTHGIAAVRIPRARVRSTLGLPKRGPLTSFVADHLEPHSPYWANKRDLAALAALAELRR